MGGFGGERFPSFLPPPFLLSFVMEGLIVGFPFIYIYRLVEYRDGLERRKFELEGKIRGLERDGEEEEGEGGVK